MDNSISGVSFGAHLSLKNESLDKHVSREMANKFAKATKSIQGTMTVSKDNMGGLDFVLNKCNAKALCIGGEAFYSMNEKEKVSWLIRVARYMNEEIKFAKLERIRTASKREIEAHIKRLDKIAGDDGNLHDINNFIKGNLLEQLSEKMIKNIK